MTSAASTMRVAVTVNGALTVISLCPADHPATEPVLLTGQSGSSHPQLFNLLSQAFQASNLWHLREPLTQTRLVIDMVIRQGLASSGEPEIILTIAGQRGRVIIRDNPDSRWGHRPLYRLFLGGLESQRGNSTGG
jgi:hypothetical protein